MTVLRRTQAFDAIKTARFVLGSVAWLAPKPALRAVLIDPGASPAAATVLRFFGARDLYMGLTLLGATPNQRDGVVRVGVWVDLADATACVIGGLTGQVGRKSALVLTGICLLGAAVGAAAVGTGPLARKDEAAGPLGMPDVHRAEGVAAVVPAGANLDDRRSHDGHGHTRR